MPHDPLAVLIAVGVGRPAAIFFVQVDNGRDAVASDGSGADDVGVVDTMSRIMRAGAIPISPRCMPIIAGPKPTTAAGDCCALDVAAPDAG